MEQRTTHPPVIILVGPTASGKTSVAVDWALRNNAEVVNADSRQVYRYLDIGAAKPTAEERRGVVHHGFDVADPAEVYSAGRFATEARSWIRDIQMCGKRVIVAGGSGLYLQALVDGFFEGEDGKDPEVRARLERRLEREGLYALWEELQQVDPKYGSKTLPADRQRILRALEVFYVTGEPFSHLHQQDRDPASFDVAWYALDWPRELLYARINQRVDMMLDRGLIAEVRSLLDRGYRDVNAMKSVGYEEVVAYFDNRLPDLKAVKEEIRKNTRHYAKRQLTWFRRNQRIHWLSAEGQTVESLVSQIS